MSDRRGGPEPDDEVFAEVNEELGRGGGMSKGRMAAVAIAVGLALAVLILGGLLLVRNIGDDDVGRPPTGGAIPSKASSPSPTLPPSASPSVSGSPSGSPTSPPTSPSGGGVSVITATGAILHPTSPGLVNPASPDADCHDLLEPGWTGDCDVVEMAGGRVAWVTQHMPAGGCCEAIAVRIFTYTASAGGWVPRLEGRDQQGQQWTEATVIEDDLTGDDDPELVAGFRFQGSGNILGIDIVTFASSSGASPRVATHPDEASHGSAQVGGGQIDEYGARYPNNEPNCCPPYFLHRVIRWNGSAFAAIVAGRVGPDSVPQSDL